MQPVDDTLALYRSLRGVGLPPRGLLAAPSHAADGDNPVCGDHLRVELRVEGDTVVEAGYAGDCCVVCRAGADIMCAAVEGRAVGSLESLVDALRAFLEGRSGAPGLALFETLRGLRTLPQRQRCAMLPWLAMQAALAGRSCASSETQAS